MTTLPTVRVTRRFRASAERVFDAWLDPDRAGRWLFATATGTITRVEIDARVGGRFVVVRREGGPGSESAEHTGTYVELDRPRRLAFDFVVDGSSPTRVTIDIAPLDTGCQVTLVHEQVLPEYAERTQGGWTKMLGGLDEVLGS